MALSRWSHSRWYIYETSDESIQICGDGHFSLEDLVSNFNKSIESLTMNESLYDSKELYCYLRLWVDVNLERISTQEYNKKINFLRRKGELRFYNLFGKFPEGVKMSSFSAKEVWSFIDEKGKSRKKTIDDFDQKLVKIEKIEKHRKISELFSVEFSYKNSKNIKIIEKLNAQTASCLLFDDEPLIEGESYIYSFKDNYFVNDFKNKEKKLEFLKQKVDLLNEKIEEISRKNYND